MRSLCSLGLKFRFIFSLKADKPFSRGAPFLKDDIELLIDFFLANFRINPHNNDTLKVCSRREFQFKSCFVPVLASLVIFHPMH